MQPKILTALILLCPVMALAADSTYQCDPSGFSLGIPPFYAPPSPFPHVVGHPLDLARLQESMAAVLSKPALFSNVEVFADGPHPDSTDLALLVSIPEFRTEVQGPRPTYKVTTGVLLVENLTGLTLYQATRSKDFVARYPAEISSDLAPSAELEHVFPVIAGEVLRDLDVALRQYAQQGGAPAIDPGSPAHESRQLIRVLPVVLDSTAGSLAGYSRYVDESLHDRLARKNCFDIIEIGESDSGCLRASFAAHPQLRQGVLRACPAAGLWTGLLLVNWLLPNQDGMDIRSVLLTLPNGEILLERTAGAGGGWRLGNSLEQLTSIIAQTVHSQPH